MFIFSRPVARPICPAQSAWAYTIIESVDGSSILLDGTGSSDPDGDDLTYTWTMSDGTTLHGASVPHTFANNGAHSVTLTVRDPLGAWNTKTMTVQVANAAPVASFTVDRGSVVSGDAVQLSGSFTDAGTQDQPWTWAINWGDGITTSSTEGAVPAAVARGHVYGAAGNYTITFTVTDKDGDFTSSSTSIQVVRRTISISVGPEAINDNDIGNARIKVEAFSDAGFDASLVNLATACIGSVCVDERGNSGKVFASLHDADGDGDLDLVMRFARRDLVRAGLLAPGAGELVFHADLTNGQQVEGVGSVMVH